MIRISGTLNIEKEKFDKDNTKEYNLLNGVKKLLENLQIQTNPLRVEKHISTREYGKEIKVYKNIFTFSITGRENFEKFHKHIRFNLEYKMKRLEKMLENYKVKQLG